LNGHPLTVDRQSIKFTPDPSRVVLRPFIPPSPKRVANVVERVANLSEDSVENLLASVLTEFRGRHK